MKRFFALIVLTVVFASCKETPEQLQKITAKTQVIDSLLVPDKEFSSFIEPYKTKVNDEVSKVISYTATDLSKDDGNLQSSLGNIMADVMYDNAYAYLKEQTGQSVDFAMSNHGGIRTAIFKGDIKVEHIYKLMPFENRIVIVELPNEKIVALFEYFMEEQRAHPLSKQVQLRIRDNKTEISFNGQPLDKNRTYFVATSDYLQKGGDGMYFFKDPLNLYDTNYLIREALIDDFTQRDTLVAILDNRIIID